MRFQFDSGKDRLSIASRGLSLAFAEQLLWDEALVWLDRRFHYDEERMIALAPYRDTLYYVAFVDHGDVRRVISLRLAEQTEVKHYVENFY